MKKTVVFFLGALLIGLLILPAIVDAGGKSEFFRRTRNNFTIGQTADTLWIPDRDAGINIDGYRHIGFEFHIVEADNIISDSMQLDIYSAMDPERDSAVLTFPFATKMGENHDTTTGRWAFSFPDSLTSSGSDWPNKYLWARIIHLRATADQGSGLMDGDTIVVDADCWSAAKGCSLMDWNTTAQTTEVIVPTRDGWGAAGDSMLDWNGQSAGTLEEDIDEGTGSLDTSQYIYVNGSDSACVIALADYATGLAEFPDSVGLKVIFGRDSTLVAACTLGFGLAFGDSSLHHYGTFITVSMQEVAVDTAVDTATYVWVLSPSSGSYWTTAEIDSLFLVLDAVHVDTTANGDNGQLKVYAVDLIPYYEGEFESEVDEGIASVDYTDFVHVYESDSVLVMTLEATATGLVDTGHYDSLVLKLICVAESTTVARCTLMYGLGVGDSAQHYYGLVMTADTLVTAICSLVTDTVTLTYSFATNPVSGAAWDSVTVDDSLFFILDAHHVDTTAAGNPGIIKVFVCEVVAYCNSLSPPLRYEGWWILKE